MRKAFPPPPRRRNKPGRQSKQQRNTLIAAPTGSGKTLAAFLAAIDDLVRLGVEGKLDDTTHVVYVSPLKALSNDIQRNLQVPLAGIQEELRAMGLPEVNIRTLVRTGDTPAADRTAMTKRPPHIVVTTPESLYILLTSEGGRRMLQTTRTLIVDEIHAVVGDKRGSHLALSIERLEQLTPSASKDQTPKSAALPRRNPTLRHSDTRNPAWFASVFLPRNVRSKKSRVFWSALQTSIATARLTAPSSTAVTRAGLIWRSNFPIRLCRP